jgi:hypothetical protein
VVGVFFFTPSWSGQPCSASTIFDRLPSLSLHRPKPPNLSSNLLSQRDAFFPNFRFVLFAAFFHLAIDCHPQYAIVIGFHSLE